MAFRWCSLFKPSGVREWPRMLRSVVHFGGKPKIASRWHIASERGRGGFRRPEPKIASRWRVASEWGWGGFRHPGGC